MCMHVSENNLVQETYLWVSEARNTSARPFETGTLTRLLTYGA